MTVPVEVGPNRRITVKIPPSFRVVEPHAFATFQNKRLVIGRAPFRHRRKWMPEVRLIEKLQFCRGHDWDSLGVGAP
jgi:hypothetical protein